MANYIIDGSLLTNIAAAIRSKKGTSATYTPAQMAAAINGMSVGATQVKVLDAVYSTNELVVPKQGSVRILLSQKIDSIRQVLYRTYSGVPLGGLSLDSDGWHILVYGSDSGHAQLNTLTVYGYVHSIQ